MRHGLNPQARERVVLERRPRYEGSNIGTWIGFKHVMYLVEEGALQFLREHGLPAGNLYERYALSVEIVDSDVRLLRALEIDDVTRIEVQSLTEPGDPELRLGVELFVVRGGQAVKAAAAQVRILFREAGGQRGRAEPPPTELLPYVSSEIRRPNGETREPQGLPERAGEPVANAFVWRRRIPYFYCHFTERIQHSGYVRILEEVVDLFLADRGISIETLLTARDWIPVVADARIEILREAFMEEELHTVYTVEGVFKRMRYTARLDCYVERAGQRIHTATGRITHAYLRIADRRTGGSLAEFDDTVMAALAGRKGAA